MKPFWQDDFYDPELSDGDIIAETYGKIIHSDLTAIEDAIRNYDLIKALSILADCKEYY